MTYLTYKLLDFLNLFVTVGLAAFFGWHDGGWSGPLVIFLIALASTLVEIGLERIYYGRNKP